MRRRRFPWTLNEKQIERLSEFTANLSLLVIASFVVPQLRGIDKVEPPVLVLGVLTAVTTLIISLILLKKRRRR